MDLCRLCRDPPKRQSLLDEEQDQNEEDDGDLGKI